MTGLRLAAIILAVMLILPGALWGQGPRPGSRLQDSPQQTDKSYLQEQQKKRRQQLKNPRQPLKTPDKGRQSGRPEKIRSKPPEQPMRGGPVNPSGL